MSVLGPTAEILSAKKTIHGFRPAGQPLAVQIRSWRICAWPKESIQRKGHPHTANSCASRFCRGFFVRASQPYEKRAASLPRPFGQISTKAAMLGRYVRDLKACLPQFVRFEVFLERNLEQAGGIRKSFA
jgi:hypothetical protein